MPAFFFRGTKQNHRSCTLDAKPSILHAICKIRYRKGEHRSRSMLPLV
nr:MAG TPA: hypothetical protein [Caudoviricetes sp.]